ncbi:Phosphatidylinositol transfer protein SEC14 [Handroanthus impetiginosus]|uniref:Phosphatidylinositol transfer protein SEC14 n=1 Tax=Handroanthus impetiginosus TaxID=429701 RepID=A0A2G9HRK3_9LAMI|nr:Phosphatidylinositol transfer protein SEC14 [Handroanthus impetiginosus]
MANFVNNKNVSKNLSIAPGRKSSALQPLRPIISNKWEFGKGTSGQVTSFLIKTIALETVRRFSRAKCPLLWNGLQGLQVFCCPPFKWIQCYYPFGFLVKGVQSISRPLLVLSLVDAFSNHSEHSNIVLDDTENSPGDGESQVAPASLPVNPSLQHNPSMRIGDENSQGLLPTDWLNRFYKELENLGITLPERLNEGEIRRFYAAANGDLSSLLSSVQKTIRWRETYRILSGEELEMWSNMIFWHGFDENHRPCLIVRLGLACTNLPSHARPRFAQAVISQVEHGVLHLVNGENPQITVLVDCQGLSPLRLPMQTMRYCCNLLQDHFPNVLGCLIVIRLPSVARVIAQTFIQVFKPATKRKLRIEGDAYHKILSEGFQMLPSYLGGRCTCTRCGKIETGSLQQIPGSSQTSSTESVSDLLNAEDFPSLQPTYQYDTIMDNYCSQTIRTAVVGILIVWVLIAFIEGIYNPETRPILPL